MYTTITNITDDEKRRFNALQEQGILPSQALKKIETEKRLGIEVKTERKWLNDRNFLYLGAGAIGIAIIYIYLFSGKKPTTQSASLNNLSNSLDYTLDKIDGIDLSALNICKEKGLI